MKTDLYKIIFSKNIDNTLNVKLQNNLNIDNNTTRINYQFEKMSIDDIDENTYIYNNNNNNIVKYNTKDYNNLPITKNIIFCLLDKNNNLSIMCGKFWHIGNLNTYNKIEKYLIYDDLKKSTIGLYTGNTLPNNSIFSITENEIKYYFDYFCKINKFTEKLKLGIIYINNTDIINNHNIYDELNGINTIANPVNSVVDIQIINEIN